MYDTSFCREFYALQFLYETFSQMFHLLKTPSNNYFEGRHKGAETSGEVLPAVLRSLEGK